MSVMSLWNLLAAPLFKRWRAVLDYFPGRQDTDAMYPFLQDRTDPQNRLSVRLLGPVQWDAVQVSELLFCGVATIDQNGLAGHPPAFRHNEADPWRDIFNICKSGFGEG